MAPVLMGSAPRLIRGASYDPGKAVGNRSAFAQTRGMLNERQRRFLDPTRIEKTALALVQHTPSLRECAPVAHRFARIVRCPADQARSGAHEDRRHDGQWKRDRRRNL